MRLNHTLLTALVAGALALGACPPKATPDSGDAIRQAVISTLTAMPAATPATTARGKAFCGRRWRGLFVRNEGIVL